MDGRGQNLRTGLLKMVKYHLLIITLLFSAGFLCPQEGEIPEPALEIRMETSPADPLINAPLSISLLINHPIPSEVNVLPPLFPSSLFLERVRTEARIVQIEASAQADDETDSPEPLSERWTRVEFLFTTRRADSVTLEPFEVIIPGRRAASGRISLRIRDTSAQVRRYEPRLRWLSPAGPVVSGTSGSFTLELSGWDPQYEVPKGIFRGRIPLNTIMEESPPSPASGGNYHYTVSLIPINVSAPTSITIEAFSFRSGNYTLSVPRLIISVLPALPAEKTASPHASGSGENPEDDLFRNAPDSVRNPEDPGGVPGFPQMRENVFLTFRPAYRRIYAGVQALWEENCPVEALAEIRRNERDSLAGPFLAPLRREMEQSLGLSFTGDENWRPLRVPLLSWIAAGILILLSVAALFVFTPRAEIRKKNVTSGGGSGFKTVIALVLAIGLVFIFLELGLGNLPIRRRNSTGNSAVLKQTPAFRVPDQKAAINTWFEEGQPVIVGDYRMTSSSGDWCYAESPDGRSGWVPREAVINY